MVIELYIDNQIVDISEDTEVTLVKEFQSDDDLERKEIQYSYELNLPITATNQKVFGYGNDMSVKRKFYKQYPCQLYAEHILVMDGSFVLTEIDNESFIGNLFVPSYKELSDVLGDRSLTEIKEHNVSFSDFTTINTLNYMALDGQNDYVSFPFILYNGAHSNFTKEIYDEVIKDWRTESVEANPLVQFTDYEDTTFTYGNIYPSYKVLTIIKEIFDTYGYKVSGNIFSDKRFNELWMTTSVEANKYKENLRYPQYLSLMGYYVPYNMIANKTTETISFHEVTQNDGNEEYKYYSDDLFHSNVTQITTLSNPHEMFKPKGDSGSIIINRSGWYLIEFDNTVNSVYTMQGKFSERANLNTSQCEVRLVKGNARADVNWYSQFGQQPISPRYNSNNNEAEVEVAANPTQKYLTKGWTHIDADGYTRFPKNGGVAKVNSYSNFNTDRFICGSRFGIAVKSKSKTSFEYEYVGDSLWHMCVLPKPNYLNWLTYDEESDSYVWALTGGVYANEIPTIYTGDTAVCMVGENVYSYNGGQYQITAGAETTRYGIKGAYGNFVLKNYSNPDFIRKSEATSTKDAITGVPVGNSHISCVAWLEEGETINAEVLTSVDYVDQKRAPNFQVQFKLNLGLLSTDKDWSPSPSNIIPEDAFSLWKPYDNNYNQFLPEMSCNDFIEAFLKTFNLRITKISDIEYSINYADIRKTVLNVVPLDKYLDYSKVTERAIDIPSEYNFNWDISDTAEGYVNGNNSMFNDLDNREVNEYPMYDGGKTIKSLVNLSGDSIDVDSRFSYNWYRTMWAVTKEQYTQWVKDGQKNPVDAWKTYGGYTWDVPIIAEDSTWKKSFDEMVKDADKTTEAPRFFYLNKDRVTYIYDGTREKIVFVNCQNHNGAFDLDYDSIPSFTGIEDSLFSTLIEPSYEVTVELALSNDDYQKIQQNTLVKINDELYRVVRIDGHSVLGDSDSELVLKALM